MLLVIIVLRGCMVNKYTFEVSYHKTIMADTLDKALDVLQDKTATLNECKKVELLEIERKGVFTDDTK